MKRLSMELKAGSGPPSRMATTMFLAHSYTFKTKCYCLLHFTCIFLEIEGCCHRD